ncbi:MAG TPA: hypothetical protein VK446_05195 [Methylocystis sp.]|nr:hypothetical protein [Methylocystis sp.]
MSGLGVLKREIHSSTGLNGDALDHVLGKLAEAIERYRERDPERVSKEDADKPEAVAQRFGAIADKLDACIEDWPEGEAQDDYEILRRLALNVRTEARLHSENRPAHRPRDDRRDRLMEEAGAILEPYIPRDLKEKDRRNKLVRAVAGVLRGAGARLPYDPKHDAAKFERAMRRREDAKTERRKRLEGMKF